VWERGAGANWGRSELGSPGEGRDRLRESRATRRDWQGAQGWEMGRGERKTQEVGAGENLEAKRLTRPVLDKAAVKSEYRLSETGDSRRVTERQWTIIPENGWREG